MAGVALLNRKQRPATQYRPLASGVLREYGPVAADADERKPAIFTNPPSGFAEYPLFARWRALPCWHREGKAELDRAAAALRVVECLTTDGRYCRARALPCLRIEGYSRALFEQAGQISSSRTFAGIS